MKVTVVIPARYASTRFPGKPLQDILGKPMIQHVCERAARAACVDRVIVATDDERIFKAVEGFGGEAQMTRIEHATGTDRLAEVAERIESDLVVNVQGDEPLIDPRMIDLAVTPLLADPGIPMGTLKSPIETSADYRNPHIVKVVTDQDGFALFFSRAPIPHARDLADTDRLSDPLPHKHIGLYVYRRDFLLRYPTLPATPLENLEKLEQLRALEHGYRIRVVATELTSQGVDTPEDLLRVAAILSARQDKD